ncbi:MAG: hypothetical protein E6H91_16440 [Chloroflexi bacterium]|nr:MAG: hypothetical protein E6H91_16440 [Chloroflexota bacterium]
MATGHAQDQRDVYAVVRLDSHRNFTPRPDYVTVKKVVSSLAEAELEVRSLNGLAPTGTVYFLQRTTVALENRPAQPVRAAPVAASAPRPAPDPRSRRARAEKKSRKKKKGRRK